MADKKRTVKAADPKYTPFSSAPVEAFPTPPRSAVMTGPAQYTPFSSDPVGAFPLPPNGLLGASGMEMDARARQMNVSPSLPALPGQMPQQAAQAPEQQQQRQGWLRGLLSNPDARARLAMALEGMTLNPNNAMMQLLSEGINERREGSAADEAKNKTAAWLRSQGREDLAQAVESGIVSGSDAFGVLQSQSAGQEPLSTLGKLEADYRAGRISKELYQAEMASMAPRGTAISIGPNGEVMFQEGVGVSAKPFTEGQSKDNVYATRAQGALATLEPVAEALTGYGQRLAEMDPTGVVRGRVQTDEYQLARQAGDEFLQAILRKDTGAAITPSEQALYGVTYLPQPGDNPAVLAQKAKSRRRAIEAVKAGMSPSQIIAQEKALTASGDMPASTDGYTIEEIQ